ncbi:hypothetical protein QE152_g4805 [Popillia japonica]|uniref:Uncharacterized protein n=1 Tax=Popillia japonica TaxID=7064 RepID=A0AAW1MZ51_POPJA
MENLGLPSEMSLEGDVVCNVRRWKQQFTIFMEPSAAADSTEMSNERKVATLLHTIGLEVRDIYNTLEVPETTKKDWKNLLDYLEHHFKLEVRDIYNTLEVPETTKKDWKNLLDYLEHHFKPKENETIKRHQFHTRKQKESESVDMFKTKRK